MNISKKDKIMNINEKKVRGFTLVEIMIVVTIIGILASLAVPAFQRARWKAIETSIRNNLRQIWGAAQQYMLENGTDSVKVSDLVKWQKRDGTDGGGTDAGYTSILQQISNESYADDDISVFISTDTWNGTDSTLGTASNTGKTVTADTQGLAVAANGKFVKLKL